MAKKNNKRNKFHNIVDTVPCLIMGDSLQNLTDWHTTKQQHTTELQTTERFGGVQARLCVICPDSIVGGPKLA